jgi:hypothetical protein
MAPESRIEIEANARSPRRLNTLVTPRIRSLAITKPVNCLTGALWRNRELTPHSRVQVPRLIAGQQIVAWLQVQRKLPRYA